MDYYTIAYRLAIKDYYIGLLLFCQIMQRKNVNRSMVVLVHNVIANLCSKFLSDALHDIAILTFDLAGDGPSRDMGLRPPSVYQVQLRPQKLPS